MFMEFHREFQQKQQRWKKVENCVILERNELTEFNLDNICNSHALS